MKLLVHGMQSSGASLFAYYLAQVTDTIGVIDLNNHRVAPALNIPLDIIMKAVITTRWSLEDHVNSFRPDKTILFLRNPYNNYYSLMSKVYANKSGTIDDKFRLLEDSFNRQDTYDTTIFYEQFITDRQGTVALMNGLGWKSTLEHYGFPRSPREVYAFNMVFCEWCRNNPAAPGPAGGWSMGNIREPKINLSLSDKPVDLATREKVQALCPNLTDYYSRAVNPG